MAGIPKKSYRTRTCRQTLHFTQLLLWPRCRFHWFPCLPDGLIQSSASLFIYIINFSCLGVDSVLHWIPSGSRYPSRSEFFSPSVRKDSHGRPSLHTGPIFSPLAKNNCPSTESQFLVLLHGYENRDTPVRQHLHIGLHAMLVVQRCLRSPFLTIGRYVTNTGTLTCHLAGSRSQAQAAQSATDEPI